MHTERFFVGFERQIVCQKNEAKLRIFASKTRKTRLIFCCGVMTLHLNNHIAFHMIFKTEQIHFLPLEITSVPLDGFIPIREGNTVSLRCQVEGVTRPTITWRRQVGEIES